MNDQMDKKNQRPNGQLKNKPQEYQFDFLAIQAKFHQNQIVETFKTFHFLTAF